MQQKVKEMTKRYTDLFIDFDDTLYDTHGNAVLSLAELFGYFHLERWFSDPEDFYAAYWKANVELWSQYSRGEISRDYLIVERFRRPLSTGSGLRPTREFCLQVSDKFLELCSCKPGVVGGAHRMMDYLKSHDYRLHLCSNGFHEVQYKKLEASRLKPYFDTIILSEDAGANKPQQAYFDYAFKVSGARADKTLMIGDNIETDIIGAKKAGLDTLYFNRWHEELTPEQLPFVDYEVDTLSDIMWIL